jgi:hypothetical protein
MWETKQISYEKTQNSLEQNKEGFVFLKKDILSPYFEFKLKQKLLKISKIKSIFYNDKVKKIKKQIFDIFDIIENHWLKKQNIQKIQILKTWRINIFYKQDDKEGKLIFDLNNKHNFFLWNSEELKQTKEHFNLQTVKILEKTNNLLQAMD